MSDLISRQAALDIINAELNGWLTDDERLHLEGVGTGIECLPSIDPVKHGKWFNTSTDIPKLLMNVCSECCFQYPSAIRPRFNYCPNCGAKMDGGEG